jgi:hypothetical protein
MLFLMAVELALFETYLTDLTRTGDLHLPFSARESYFDLIFHHRCSHNLELPRHTHSTPTLQPILHSSLSYLLTYLPLTLEPPNRRLDFLYLKQQERTNVMSINDLFSPPPARRGAADEEMMSVSTVSPNKRRHRNFSPPVARSLLLDTALPTEPAKLSADDATMSLYSPIESANNVVDDDDDDDYEQWLNDLTPDDLSPRSSTPRSNKSTREPTSTSTPTSEHEDDDDDARRQREEEASMELARQMMAEEAMASYHHHFQLVRDSAELSQEDREALQAALAEDEREAQEEHAEEIEQDEEGNMSYETMLQLGERIGNVKSERWTMVAQKHIAKLPVFTFQNAASMQKADGKEDNDSDLKCLVCQCDYEQDEGLRRLPCGHCFHTDCVDQWLTEKDFCPYCRQTIVCSDTTASPHQH